MVKNRVIWHEWDQRIKMFQGEETSKAIGRKLFSNLEEPKEGQWGYRLVN